jgi:PAS domain S-box-containing protein
MTELKTSRLRSASPGDAGTDEEEPEDRSSKLGRSERELADFFDNASIGLHWVGPDGTILRANRAELEMLGYDRDEYVGHNVAEFHVDQEAIQGLLSRLRHGNTVRQFPADMRCRDGSVRNVLINSSGMWEEGRFVHSRCFTLDMTDSKWAEGSKELAAAIVSTSDDAILSKSLDGTILSWNPAAERLFGYPAEEAVGRRIDLIIPRELLAEEERILGKLRAGEHIDHFETVRVAKDGQRLNISLSVAPVRNAADQVVGASTIARDMTERRRTEEALRASEERYRALVESQAEMLCRFRPDGTILYANPAYAHSLDTTPEALMSGNFWDFIPESDRKDVRGMLDRMTPQSPEIRIENRFDTADGERWILWTNRAMAFDASGRLTEAQSTGIDITERRRAEEALRESERRFKDLANNIDQFAWTCDELGQVTWYNRRWHEYTGTDLDSMAGDGWRAVHHPDHVERVESSLLRAVQGEEPWEETFPLRGKDGQYRWFLSRAVPIRDDDGRVIRWFGTNTDITELRELTQALRAADRRKDEFTNCL